MSLYFFWKKKAQKGDTKLVFGNKTVELPSSMGKEDEIEWLEINAREYRGLMSKFGGGSIDIGEWFPSYEAFGSWYFAFVIGEKNYQMVWDGKESCVRVDLHNGQGSLDDGLSWMPFRIENCREV